MSVSITAMSWSSRVQPVGRPEFPARSPEIQRVQSPPVSSRQAPPASCFTIRLTSGATPLAGFFAGMNTPVPLKEGLRPLCGVPLSSTTFGGKSMMPAPSSALPINRVDLLPDSKMAAYTVSPSGLTASARGSSAFTTMPVGGTERSAGSNTWMVPDCEQDTKACTGLPANTTSLGSSRVSMVSVTFHVVRLTTLTLSEIWFTTHSSLLLRKRAETGS